MSATKETEWERRTRRARERAEHVAANGPACQICGNVPKRGLDQDHDHRTGKTRGWLDHRCNRGLPSWVTPWWLIRAAIYLLPSSAPDPRLKMVTVELVNAIHTHPEKTVAP